MPNHRLRDSDRTYVWSNEHETNPKTEPTQIKEEFLLEYVCCGGALAVLFFI